MVLHRQILFNMAIAEAILMQTSAEQVAPRYLKPITSNLFSTDAVQAVGYKFGLFCADFHSISRCSVYESVVKVLKLTVAAALTANVYSNLQ